MPTICSLSPYADGASLLASTLAIMNIVLFEHKLEVILQREDFKPFLKFASIKVLVSAVFFQQMCLKLLGELLDFSSVQIDLIYACLICFEMPLLACVMLHAWRPHRGDWYNGDFPQGAPRGRLAGESGSFMTSEEFMQTRRPTTTMAMPVGGANTFDLRAVIELRGDVNPEDGRVLENLFNSLSMGRIKATYKPAVLFVEQHRDPFAGEALPPLPLGRTSAGDSASSSFSKVGPSFGTNLGPVEESDHSWQALGPRPASLGVEESVNSAASEHARATLLSRSGSSDFALPRSGTSAIASSALLLSPGPRTDATPGSDASDGSSRSRLPSTPLGLR